MTDDDDWMRTRQDRIEARFRAILKKAPSIDYENRVKWIHDQLIGWDRIAILQIASMSLFVLAITLGEESAQTIPTNRGYDPPDPIAEEQEADPDFNWDAHPDGWQDEQL